MKEYLLSAVDRSQSFTAGLATVDLTGEEADTFFDALASATTRELLEALYAAPATPSELAELSDTSLQNVHYHLEKLEAADLIEPVDMVYSSRGREVTVYGPTNRAIVLVAGDSSLVADLKSAVARFVGVLAVLAVGALLVQALVAGGPLADLVAPEPAPIGDAAAPSATPTGDEGVVRSGNTTGGDGDVTALDPTATRAADAVAGGATEARTATPMASPSSNATATPTPSSNVTATPTPTPTPTG